MEDIEDFKSDDSETQDMVRRFKFHLQSQVQESKAAAAVNDAQKTEQMTGFIKAAIWRTFKWKWLTCTLFGIFAECAGIYSCYFISKLIGFIRDEDAELMDGVILLLIFALLVVFQQLCRNFYIHYGYMCALWMRRTLVAVIFDQLCELSMKSLMSTNSGKLVQLISADLYTVERLVALAHLILAWPIVNAFAYVLIGLLSSWDNALIVFAVWILIVIVQTVAGILSRKIKAIDSSLNDERLKLVNDMVVGVRTLKCYGWEGHFLDKITAVRKKQQFYLFFYNALSTVGFSLFQSLAVLSAFLIFYN